MPTAGALAGDAPVLGHDQHSALCAGGDQRSRLATARDSDTLLGATLGTGTRARPSMDMVKT